MEAQIPTAKIAKSLFCVFLSSLCFLWLAVPLSAQSVKSYLPVLGGTDADLGLAFVNPTLVDAAVTFTLHGYDGSLLQGADIVNPASLPLPASRQKALMAAEIFGQGISGKRGWIELTLSAPTIRGFFLLFDSQLNFVDGTDLIFNIACQLFFSY